MSNTSAIRSTAVSRSPEVLPSQHLEPNTLPVFFRACALVTGIRALHIAPAPARPLSLLESVRQNQSQARIFHQHHWWLGNMAVSASGEVAVSTCDDGTSFVWNLVAGAPSLRLQNPGFGQSFVSMSGDSRWVVRGCRGSVFALWDLTSNPPSCRQLEGNVGEGPLVFSGDSKLMASARGTGPISLCNLQGGHRVDLDLGLPSETPVTSLAFFSGTRTLVAGLGDGRLRLCHLQPDTLSVALEGHAKAVNRIVVSPDDKHIATVADGGEVKLHNLQAQSRRCWSLPGHEGGWTCTPTFSPGGEWLATGLKCGDIALWPLADPGGPPRRLVGGTSRPSILAFAPDARTLASAWSAKCVALTDLTAPGSPSVEVYPLNNWGGDSTLSLCFSRDGEMLISAQHDGKVRFDSIAGSLQADQPRVDERRAPALPPPGRGRVHPVPVAESLSLRAWSPI